MNKQEFLSQLRKGLSALPRNEIDEQITYYGEMIDDRIEEGLTEEEAASEIGSINELISRIVTETPLYVLVKERAKPKKSLKTWEILLIVLGSPLWLSLIIAAAAVMLSLYLVICSLIIALWATEIALAAGIIGSIASVIVFMYQGNALAGIAMLGLSFFCSGLFILWFFLCKDTGKSLLNLTKRIAAAIKSRFIAKEDVQ